MRTGDLRQHFEEAAQAQSGSTGVPGPTWQITPSIELSELLTDDAYAGSTGKPQWDLESILTPSVNVVGDTSRLKVNLTYSPSVTVYAGNSSLDDFGQNLNGNAHAILIPETLFVDVTAYAGLQSLAGGVANSSVVGQNRSNQAQTYSFSAAPYLQHRFGSLGLGELGLSESYSETQSLNSLTGQNLQLQGLSPQLVQLEERELNQGVGQHVVTQTEHASFNSGEDFGRVNLRAYGSVSQYDGNGIYQHARNNYATLDLGYALTRAIATIGQVGYEDIAYSGVPPIAVRDVIWAGGLKLTPGVDTSIVATYGRRFGRPNAFLDASYAVTPRLKLYARYSQSLTTNLQDVQDALAQIELDSAGGVYDRGTGAPVGIVDNFFSLQSGVFRLSRGSVNAVLIYVRDTVSFVVSSEMRKLVSAAPDSIGVGSSRGTYGTLTWSHDVNPSVTANAYIQYGRNGESGLLSSSEASYTASVGVTYALSESTKLSGLYSFQQSQPLIAGASTSQNYVLVGLRKRF